MPTPEEVAAAVYRDTHSFPVNPDGAALRGLMVRAIEADRAQRQEGLKLAVEETMAKLEAARPRSLRECAQLYGLNLHWDATVKGTPPGHSYIAIGAVPLEMHDNDLDTITQAVRLVQAGVKHLSIHAGYN